MYWSDRSKAPWNTQKTVHTAQRNIESITARAGSCLAMKTLVCFKFAVVYYAKANKSGAILFECGAKAVKVNDPGRAQTNRKMLSHSLHEEYSEFQIVVEWKAPLV